MQRRPLVQGRLRLLGGGALGAGRVPLARRVEVALLDPGALADDEDAVGHVQEGLVGDPLGVEAREASRVGDVEALEGGLDRPPRRVPGRLRVVGRGLADAQEGVDARADRRGPGVEQAQGELDADRADERVAALGHEGAHHPGAQVVAGGDGGAQGRGVGEGDRADLGVGAQHLDVGGGGRRGIGRGAGVLRAGGQGGQARQDGNGAEDATAVQGRGHEPIMPAGGEEYDGAHRRVRADSRVSAGPSRADSGACRARRGGVARSNVRVPRVEGDFSA